MTFQLGIYFIVGFIETFLSTQRTYWITQGKSKSASAVVFLESLIYMYIFYQLMTNLGGSSVWIILFYAFGNAIGTYVNLEKVPF